MKRRCNRKAIPLSIMAVGGTFAASVAFSNAMVFAQTASADQQDSAAISFAVPPQALAPALATFGHVADLQVLYTAKIAGGLRTQGVYGSYIPTQALSRLLAGTGLTYRFTNARTVTIERADAAASASFGQEEGIRLETVEVEAQTISNWDAPPPYAGGQVATGSRLGLLGNTSIMNMPFNDTSYTSKTIQDQQAVTVADVALNDPSVRVFTTGLTSSAGQGDSLRIRGFTVGASTVLFNGLPSVAPLRLIPVETMESVEILNGPNALLNSFAGYSALGGIVNVVPKRATDTPITRVTTSYISDSLLGAHVDVGRRFGENNEWGIRANGLIRSGDTVFGGQSATLGAATLALDYRGDIFRASLDAGYVNSKVKSPLGAAGFGFASDVTSFTAPDLNKQIYQDWEYATSESTYLVGRFELDLAPTWTAYGAIGYRSYTEKFLSTDIYVTDNFGNASATAYYTPFNGYALPTLHGVRGQFATGEVTHNINLAASYILQEMNYTGQYYGFYSFDTNIYNAPRVAAPSTLGFTANPPKYWYQTFPTIALADTLSILEDRILFTSGVRYQRIAQDIFNSNGTISQQYDNYAFTPAFALVVKPLDRLSLYANYIEGLEQGPTAWGGANVGQVFPPVHTEQIETGLKYDFGTVIATLSFFQITQPNSVITTDSSGASTFGLNGEQRNRGIELNLFGEIIPGVRALGGVAYTQGTLTKTADGAYDGNAAIGVPNWQGNFGIEWDPSFIQGLTLSSRVIATSSQYIDQANTQKIPGWSRFDFGAQYRIDALANPLVLRARVENAFDRNYWAGVDGGWVAMGTPRTFKVSATMDF